jgi:hypothetical protein
MPTQPMSAFARPKRPSARALSALVKLRWSMVRGRGPRVGLMIAMLTIPLLCTMSVVIARNLPDSGRVGIALITPTLLLGFLILSITAPLAAGGGNELYPANQLVAYPIRPRTIYASSLLLSPLNLAWLVQAVLALGFISYGETRGGWSLALPLLTIACYLAMVTVGGQSLAWFIVGSRRRRMGRIAWWVAFGVVVVAVLTITRAGLLTTMLDRLPTRAVLFAARDPDYDHYKTWAIRTIAMLISIPFLAWLGVIACGWSIRRPSDMSAEREGRLVRRRSPRGSLAAEVRAVDRASVRRSAPLRRGALLLGLLPGAVAAVASIRWDTLVLVPGLIASGGALLFGVNAFCLDGSGSVWLSTLPASSNVFYWSKVRVVAETVLVAMTLGVGMAATRASDGPNAAQIAAVICTGLVSTALVTSTAIKWSITRPHPADLRGPRDTPAPPGSMAVYSMRLALATTGMGLLFSVLSVLTTWWSVVLVAVAMIALPLRSLVARADEFADPAVRARVVATVAGA